MKTTRMWVLIMLVAFASVGLAQKQKKTYDSEAFAKKVKFSFVPEYVNSRGPDAAALDYIARKTGKSLSDVRDQDAKDRASLKEDVTKFSKYNMVFNIEKVEETVKQESPIKIADITMYCIGGTTQFTVTLENCVQTDVSWYLGDGVSWAGDIFGEVEEELAEEEAKQNAEKEQREREKTQKERQQFVFDSLRVTRPGWEADYSTFEFDPAKEGLPMKGYYITKTGEKVDAVIAYQKPEFFVGDFAASAQLYICKNESSTKVDLLNPDPNHKEYISKDQIKAFYVDDRMYKNYGSEGWGIALDEGAIHSFITVIKIQANGQTSYQSFKRTQKINGDTYGSVISSITDKNRLAFMADAPEIVAAFNNGERDINETEVAYNKWYEEQHPGKVDYIFGSDYGLADFEAKYKKTETVKNEGPSEYEKEVMEDIDQAHRAEPIDWYKGRPSEADASVASAKPEVPVKKESFVDRLNRIKTEGNKVGVLVRCGNLIINPKDFAEGITKANVKGSYEPLTETEKLGKKVVDELAKGFGIDVFELVDYSKIPVKGGSAGIMDDWWSTKYKMIFIYDLYPYYNAYYKTNTSSGEREYKAQMCVDSELIVMSADDDKQEKLRYVTSSPKPWGSYRSEFFIGPSSTDIHKIQDLKAAINPPADGVVIDALIQSQQEHIEKFISKKSK